MHGFILLPKSKEKSSIFFSLNQYIIVVFVEYFHNLDNHKIKYKKKVSKNIIF